MLKTLAIISFLIAVAFVPLRSAHAQTLAYRVRVNIPFEFTVADETLPAGDYYIYRTQQYSSDNVLTISTVDGRVLAVQLTNGVQTLTPKKQGVLVFNRYGNKHFLSQVWIAGSNTGRAFLPARSEQHRPAEWKQGAGHDDGERRGWPTVSG